MPSAYRVPMASDVLPDPDTPTTATVRHSGTSTSMSLRLFCRAPRTSMTAGRVLGTGRAVGSMLSNLSPATPGTSQRLDPLLGAGDERLAREDLLGQHPVDLGVGV